VTALPLIAIVDDDASVRDAMGQLVRSFDLAVELYASGQALLQSASIGRIRCVVCDVRMPGIDGFALCTALRALGLDVPVILMTAYAQDGDEQRALDVGATGFLGKPFQERELLRCLARALASGESGSGI